MNKLIYQLYYSSKITQDVAILLLDKLSEYKDKRKY
jgi:hypothetical protein